MIFSVRQPFYHTTQHWEVRTLNEEKKKDRREAGLESRESHLRSPYNHNKLNLGISHHRRVRRGLNQEGRVHEREEEANAGLKWDGNEVG